MYKNYLNEFCVLKDDIVDTMGPDAIQYLTFQKFIIVYILFTTFISIGDSTYFFLYIGSYRTKIAMVGGGCLGLMQKTSLVKRCLILKTL